MTSPTILPPGVDPFATLRTMAAFIEDGRGIAEICDTDKRAWANQIQQRPGIEPVIGLAILSKNPEKTPIHIYDTATRAVEVVMLADWLRARGYEASACRWNRKGGPMIGAPANAPIAWELVTGPAAVPAMPPVFPGGVSAIMQPQQAGKSWAQRFWESGQERE